jgi:predicted NAD-dependent protein-ADP-ribosyltransferase YbiA (DUF1768 family)
MIKEFQGEYRWLSNFYPVAIRFQGWLFPSVEHAYQSAKSDDIHWKRFCLNPDVRAGEVKKRSHHIAVVPGWRQGRLKIMEELVDLKYDQEPFKSKLLATMEEHIQEGNFWYDTFWGVDLRTGRGENNLGKIIMEKRQRLQYVSSQES